MRALVKEDVHQITRFCLAKNEISWTKEALKQAFQHSLEGSYLVKVALDQATDQVLGYAIANYVVDKADVQNIVVNRLFRGQGIGRELLLELINDLAKREVKTVFLEVRPSNHRAVSLYQSMGFKCIQKRRDYYPGVNDVREDACVFSRACL